MGWLNHLRRVTQTSTLGKSDIPWWLGVILLLGLLYASSMLPSELKPLSVLGTVPRAGAVDVPVDTELVIFFGAGGLQETCGDLPPLVSVRYHDATGSHVISTTVTCQGDILRAAPSRPLPPGQWVEAALRTRFNRDLVWTFSLTAEPHGPKATPWRVRTADAQDVTDQAP